MAAVGRCLPQLASALSQCGRSNLYASSLLLSARLHSTSLARTRQFSVQHASAHVGALSSSRSQHGCSITSFDANANHLGAYRLAQQVGCSALCIGPMQTRVVGRAIWNPFAIGSVRFLGGQKDKQRRLAWKKVPGLGLPGGGKIKTHKGVSKRFTVSKRGKVGFFAMGRNHFNYGTSGRKRQQLRKKRYLQSKKQAKTIRQMLVKDRRPRFPHCPRGEPLKLRAKPLEGPLDEHELMDYTPLSQKLKEVQKKKFLES